MKKFLISTLIVCLLLGLSVFGYRYKLAVDQNHQFQQRVYELSEEHCEYEGINQMLLDALAREHCAALRESPQLLVCNLAWIDENKGTHYIEMIVGPDEEHPYEKAKALFEKDKTIRDGAISVVENYLNEPYLYGVSKEYFNYLIGHDVVIGPDGQPDTGA